MQHYTTRYPRNGQVAILCEGDIAGYESVLLEEWTGRQPGLGLVDVWPCGTKTAIYGICDAIGRGIPTCVIEDRDSRSQETADKDCRGNLKDRQERGVDVVFWRAWQRNEIENYLVEPCVAYPILAHAFDTTESEVATLLQETLRETAIDQALQFTLDEFRASYPKGEKDVGGVQRSKGRPRWDAGGFVIPARKTVEELLDGVLTDSLRRLEPAHRPDNTTFIKMFREKCDEWSEMDIDDVTWRTEWTGKDILQWLRFGLSSRYGWPESSDNPTKVSIKWEALDRKDRGEKDRQIERTLQPRLAKQFLRVISPAIPVMTEVAEEWTEIRRELKNYISSRSAV